MLLSMSKILFSSNKPQAVFTYWLTSNCFSLGQVALLRHPLIRDRLRIPERIQHPASALPQNDGFIQSMKKGQCLTVWPTELINVWCIFLAVVLNLWRKISYSTDHLCFCRSGWKNAQLAQQLEERERRIKNHLDLAAKGQSHHHFIIFA